jgi:hypothetical protein
MPGMQGDALREWRRSMGWDVPETAKRLRGTAEGSVASQSGLVRMIYAWERGEHELTERYELLYRKLGFTATPAGHNATYRGEETAADQISVLLDELAGQAVEFGRLAESASVGSGTIGQLDAAIDRISRDYAILAPVPLIRRAAAVRSKIFQLLGERQRLSYTRDLYVVAAKCCAFLSWAAGDLGQLAAAATEGRTALILAEEAGHPGARALAYCALSKTAYWDGQVVRAATMARQGFECCPVNTTRVLLACQECDALPLGHAGDAITRARNALDSATADDDLPGLFSAGAVRLANYTISYQLKAGHAAAALDVARAAMPLPGEQVGYGTWGQLHIGAAIAAAQNRQLDEAAGQLAPVLGLPAGQRLATLTGRLGVLARTLTSGAYRSDPSASVLVDEIRAYCDAGTDKLALEAGEETG